MDRADAGTPLGMPLDVITIGRSSVDLYGQQIGSRLEDITSFAKSVGGCPANIAVGTARLGLRSALLSRVGDEQMGRFIREQMVREGVATDGVITDPERLSALVILSVENDKSFPLIFYRENCADMALDEGDVDPDFIQFGARSRGHRHAFFQAEHRCGAAQGHPPDERSGRQGCVRHRLPPQSLGPCRTRERRQPLHRLRCRVEPSEDRACRLRPDRRHGRGSADCVG